MQSDNGTASPCAHNRRQPKQPRSNQNHGQYSQNALSDSNLPNANTPRGKKANRAKQNQSDERASSMNVPNNKHDHSHQRNRPVSTAANPVAVTPSKPAYAGSTFQASPAPASLPMPKFFSKSVPSSNPDSALQARMDKESQASERYEMDNNSLKPMDSGERGHSPLDMFFRADREEKARKQSTSTLNIVSTPSRSETPHRQKDLFPMDVEEAESPAAQRAQKSTPYGPGAVTQTDDDQRAAYTMSLKNLLKVGGPDSSREELTQSPAGHTGSPLSSRQSPVATPPNTHYQQHPNDFHYGNRNLSPLFQAARNDSPSRPSPLRQTSQPNFSSNQDFSQHYQQPQPSSPFLTRPPQFVTKQTPQAQPPNSGQYYSQPSHSPSRNYVQPPDYPQPQYLPQQQQQQQQQQERSGQNSDVKSMEDSLRKMLKLS